MLVASVGCWNFLCPELRVFCLANRGETMNRFEVVCLVGSILGFLVGCGEDEGEETSTGTCTLEIEGQVGTHCRDNHTFDSCTGDVSGEVIEDLVPEDEYYINVRIGSVEFNENQTYAGSGFETRCVLNGEGVFVFSPSSDACDTIFEQL